MRRDVNARPSSTRQALAACALRASRRRYLFGESRGRPAREYSSSGADHLCSLLLPHTRSCGGNRQLLIWSVYWPGGRKRALLLLLLLLIGFFVFEFEYPHLSGVDEIVFKSAGLNLAKGGRFAAPELEGLVHADPPIELVYARYPPLYTWLFGQWTRWTEFGWAACVGYDALISAVLAIIIYGLADAVAGILLGPFSVPRRSALALLAALLTLFFRQVARPDELGMVFGFANVWWLFTSPATWPQKPWVTFVSGVLAGLMLCTSPGVFLSFMPLLAALLLWRVNNLLQVIVSVAAG